MGVVQLGLVQLGVVQMGVDPGELPRSASCHFFSSAEVLSEISIPNHTQSNLRKDFQHLSLYMHKHLTQSETVRYLPYNLMDDQDRAR